MEWTATAGSTRACSSLQAEAEPLNPWRGHHNVLDVEVAGRPTTAPASLADRRRGRVAGLTTSTSDQIRA